MERATRLVGDDLEAWRTRLLSGSITVFRGDGAANDASLDGSVVRKPLKEGQILCVGLDGTGVAGAPLPVKGRGQMRYDEYLWLGLPIGSGCVDAVCL